MVVLRQLVVLPLQAFLTGRSVEPATVAETPYRFQASHSSPVHDNGEVKLGGGDDNTDDDLDDDDNDDDANYDDHQHWGSAHSGGQTATSAGATAGREPTAMLENKTGFAATKNQNSFHTPAPLAGREARTVGRWINCKKNARKQIRRCASKTC